MSWLVIRVLAVGQWIGSAESAQPSLLQKHRNPIGAAVNSMVDGAWAAEENMVSGFKTWWHKDDKPNQEPQTSASSTSGPATIANSSRVLVAHTLAQPPAPVVISSPSAAPGAAEAPGASPGGAAPAASPGAAQPGQPPAPAPEDGEIQSAPKRQRAVSDHATSMGAKCAVALVVLGMMEVAQ